MSPKQTKADFIEHKLTQMIRNGSLPAEGKLPSEHQLMAEYQVSRFTVRQAIRKLTDSGLVKAVRGSGYFVQGKFAEPDKSSHARTIHLMNLFFNNVEEFDQHDSLLLRELAKVAARNHFSLTVSAIFPPATLETFLEENAIPCTFLSGVILRCPFALESIRLLREKNIPHVVLPYPRRDFNLYPMVGSDTALGIEYCLRHLLDTGHRRIGMISAPVDSEDYQIIYRIYQNLMAEYQLPFDPGLIAPAAPWIEMDGIHAINLLLGRDGKLDAIAGFGDRSILGAVKELLRRKIRIPEDISVVNHGNYSWINPFFPFKISGTLVNFDGIVNALWDVLKEQRDTGIILPQCKMIAPCWSSGNSVAFRHDKNMKQMQST